MGVEPTQDLLQPRTGFEDQFALNNIDLPLRPVFYGVEICHSFAIFCLKWLILANCTNEENC